MKFAQAGLCTFLLLTLSSTSFSQNDSPSTSPSSPNNIPPASRENPTVPTPTPTIPEDERPEPAQNKKRNNSPNSDERIKMDDKGRVQLDFINTEIADLAQSIGELTKRNFIIDDKVRGTVSIISPQPVSLNEAYQAFVSALEVKGFSITKVGKMHKIVPTKEMNKLQDVSSPPGGDDAFVTRLITVRHAQASEIAKAVKFFLSKNGDLFAYPPTNTLIVTDSLGNMRRITQIVDRLDIEGFQETINVIPLKYAPAVETSEKIKKILDLGNGGVVTGAPAGGDDKGGGVFQYTSKVLPDDRTNSIIVVSNEEGYRKILEIIQKIDRAITDAGSGRIHVHYLQYADAVELATTLAGVSASAAKKSQPGPNERIRRNAPAAKDGESAQAAAAVTAGLLGGDVEIVADEQTNSLIITASSNDYLSLIPVINKLDTRRPQAFVEAMILEVDINKASELGVSANAATELGSNNTVGLFGATTFGTTSSIFLPTNPDAINGLVIGARSSTIEIPLGPDTALTIPLFGSFFRALQTNGTINVLSTPTILTRDNMEAEIIVGQKVPFVTVQGRDVNNQPINQVQREDVALTLRVKPQINFSDELTMDLYQEIQDIVPSANSDLFGPTTSKRSTKTSVLVKNGQTITIGGLISDRTSVNVSKVPLLGDIPLLGWLFRSRSGNKTRLSLVIYLTPTIIRTPEDLEDVTVRKNNERKSFLEKNRAQEHPGITNYNLNRDLRAPLPPTPVDGPTSGFLSNPKTNQ